MSLAVVTILKDAAPVLREWVLHYIAEGAVVYLINNGSTDDWRAELTGLWHRIRAIDRTVVNRLEALEFGLQTAKNEGYQSVLFADLHEFAFARTESLADYCRTHLGNVPGQVTAIRVQPKVFCWSSGPRVDCTACRPDYEPAFRSLLLASAVTRVDGDTSTVNGEAILDNDNIAVNCYVDCDGATCTVQDDALKNKRTVMP